MLDVRAGTGYFDNVVNSAGPSIANFRHRNTNLHSIDLYGMDDPGGLGGVDGAEGRGGVVSLVTMNGKRGLAWLRSCGWCGGFVTGIILTTVISLIVGAASSPRPEVHRGGSDSGTLRSNGGPLPPAEQPPHRKLQVTTWNVAAHLQNPFEYWMTDTPENYETVLQQIQTALQDPPESLDVPVVELLTPERYEELETAMQTVAGWDTAHYVRETWEKDWSQRKAISEFLKDADLVEHKGLVTEADAATNTIPVIIDANSEENPDRGDPVYCRPSVMNRYPNDVSDLNRWWTNWMKFMFVISLEVPDDANPRGGRKDVTPFQLLTPLRQADFPRLSKDEEASSLPLQMLACAIFDAVWIHLMNTASSSDLWLPLRRNLSHQLMENKVSHSVHILKTHYLESDVVTLQEVTQSFVELAQHTQRVEEAYNMYVSQEWQPSRNVQSMIWLKKTTFERALEVTALVLDALEHLGHTLQDRAASVRPGDLMVLKATDYDGVNFIIASFHGGASQGVATEPILVALTWAVNDQFPNHHLIFGLDAGTVQHSSNDHVQSLSVQAFGEEVVKRELASCWGKEEPQPTTHASRTYIQPRLSLACPPQDEEKTEEMCATTDRNPKDFILFPREDFTVVRTWKDNTGRGEYYENLSFPTLEFPSDHGIVSSIIAPGNMDDDEDDEKNADAQQNGS